MNIIQDPTLQPHTIQPMRVPNLFIVGAPRCGTTAMFTFLGEHPDIFPAAVKEPHFFSQEDQSDAALEAYLRLFAGATDERWVLEASWTYMSSHVAAERILSISPGSRAIAMVRNPLDIIQSLHHRESVRFRDPSGSLRAALDREDRGLRPRYKAAARTGAQLTRFLGVFPRDRLHVIVYDDFAIDVPRAYAETLAFLEVDTTFKPPFRVINQDDEPRSGTAQRMLWRRTPLRHAIRAVLPRALRQHAWKSAKQLNSRPYVRPPLDPVLRGALWTELEPDVALLSSLLDRDLVSLWQPR